MERTAFKLDALRFTLGEKCHDVPINERHVSQIDHQPPPRHLYDKQLSDLLDILRLHPATESENHLTVC